MTPERWQQIKAVFNLALEYEPGQRSSFFVRYPAWSRNKIVYEYAEQTGNIWMFELK